MTDYANEASVWVCEAGQAENAPSDSVVCELGQHLRFNYDHLADFSARSLEGYELDLFVVLGTIVFADRTVKRLPSRGWPRRLVLCIPVHDKPRWSGTAVFNLVVLLKYLTGDSWHFDFRERRRWDDRGLQLRLALPVPSGTTVVPFSGGLDSFVAIRHLDSEPNVEHVLPLCIASTTSVASKAQSVAKNSSHHVLRFPLSHSLPHNPESSYRTRSLLFYGIAGLACHLANGRSVVIPENGQGAVAVSLVPFGDEHPYVGSHPAMTQRLSVFLSALLGTDVPFLHPFVWQTKGEALRQVASGAELNGALGTTSCSRNSARHKGVSDIRHCGICGNCMLRRQSALASGIRSLQEERYLWHDLNASDLAQSAVGVTTTITDRQIATASVITHEHLARLNSDDASSSARLRCAGELAESLGISAPSASKRLHRLLVVHENEWRTFVSGLSDDSWLRVLAEA